VATNSTDPDGREPAGTTIRILEGSATGPTALSARDAALADAGVHDYNLLTLSSVIPADATLERVDEAPDLGPIGARLHVVEGAATASGPATVRAGLAWTREDGGPGLFYEDGGESDEATIRQRLERGISEGRRLRGWGDGEVETLVTRATADDGAYAAAVVLATYGRAEPFE
jgi:arginine decarboxylase